LKSQTKIDLLQGSLNQFEENLLGEALGSLVRLCRIAYITLSFTKKHQELPMPRHSLLKLNVTLLFIKQFNWHTDDTDYTDSHGFLIGCTTNCIYQKKPIILILFKSITSPRLKPWAMLKHNSLLKTITNSFNN